LLGFLRIGSRGMAIGVLLVCSASVASAEYTVGWYCANGGGGSQSAAGMYALGATLGEVGAGALGAGSYSLLGGFWAGANAAYLVGVDNGQPGAAPPSFQLHSLIPNPFVDRTQVRFDVPRAGFVDLRVYDIAGRLQRILASGTFAAGRYERSWDGTNDLSRRVRPGIYFVVLQTQSVRLGQRVAIIR
jgi:hypothetical protein